MLALRGAKPHDKFLRVHVFCLSIIFILLAQAPRALSQERPGVAALDSPPQEHVSQGRIATLADLLTEAEKNNPQIQAARQSWQAAKQVPSQVSTLPDPQFTVQSFSVGSPKPFP